MFKTPKLCHKQVAQKFQCTQKQVTPDRKENQNAQKNQAPVVVFLHNEISEEVEPVMIILLLDKKGIHRSSEARSLQHRYPKDDIRCRLQTNLAITFRYPKTRP
ncbi:hypothetical protein RUM43_002258 [Polyplax serrata]|uniref:Uncharacterized protein n=1 Tax=Polyplax serrata TaxID=468196 RepID=A0AAN8NYJ9_POLSC